MALVFNLFFGDFEFFYRQLDELISESFAPGVKSYNMTLNPPIDWEERYRLEALEEGEL